MSTENVYKLLALGEKDGALRAQIEGAGDSDAGMKAVVALGKKRGLDFTADELLGVAAATQQSRPDGALSDDDLGKVSGGVWNPGGGSRDTFASGGGCVQLPFKPRPGVLPGVPTPAHLDQGKRGVLPGVPTPSHLKGK